MTTAQNRPNFASVKGNAGRFRPPPPIRTAGAARIWEVWPRHCQQKTSAEFALAVIGDNSAPAGVCYLTHPNQLALTSSRKGKCMKARFRMFRRGKVFWCQDNGTGKQETLGTKDREAALRVLHAKNEAERQTAINLQIARAYRPELQKYPGDGVNRNRCDYPG